jgi:hypothetical protein
VRKRDPISAAELLVFGRRAGNPFHLPQRHRDGFNWLQAPIVHDAHRLRTAAGAKHPNQKPVALLEKLIRRSTDPGDLVIDPFSGTGAVGEAALRTGRRFLGVEIDPDWVQASRKHLAAVEAELAGGPTARKPARRPRRAPAPAPTAAPAEESDAAAAQAYSVTAILGPARTRRASRAPAAEVAPAALAPLENPPAPTT